MVCTPMVCTPMVYKFFRQFFNNEFFRWIFSSNFFDEFFQRMFFDVSDEFFRQIFSDEFFFPQIFYLLTIASFRIGVPSILFFYNLQYCKGPFKYYVIKKVGGWVWPNAYVCLQGGWVGVSKCLRNHKNLQRMDFLKKNKLISGKGCTSLQFSSLRYNFEQWWQVKVKHNALNPPIANFVTI